MKTGNKLHITENYYFQCSWKITLASALFLPLLLYLGGWQLTRAQEKEQLLIQFNEKMNAKPMALVDINSNVQWQPYQKVSLSGRFDHSRSFYLDNQITDNQVGFDVITPFLIGSQQMVLINRGFVPRTREYNVLPDVPKPDIKQLKLTGYVYIPPGDSFLLGESIESQSTWPKMVQSANVKQLSQVLDAVVFPYIIRLDENQPGVLRRHWKTTSIQPEKHQAYAFQWFTMALVLFCLWCRSSIYRINP